MQPGTPTVSWINLLMNFTISTVQADNYYVYHGRSIGGAKGKDAANAFFVNTDLKAVGQKITLSIT